MAANKILNVPQQYVPNAAGNLFNCAVVAQAPVALALSTLTTGGTLAAATYYYVVTALNAAGESQKSNELSVTTTGATSSNTLSWAPVAGATSYRVYRGTAAGTETVYYLPGNVNTYLDTNAASNAGSPPVVGTATFGPVGFTPTQPYAIIKHIRLANTDTVAHNVTLYKGASGGSAGSTVFGFPTISVQPNSAYDMYCQARFDATDFLTGVCDAASKVTIEIDGEIGLS